MDRLETYIVLKYGNVDDAWNEWFSYCYGNSDISEEEYIVLAKYFEPTKLKG